MQFDLDGKLIKPQICALCGRHRGDHKAKTLHCPLGRKNLRFPHFSQTQTYTEKANNKGE